MIKYSKKVLKYLNSNTTFSKGLAISDIAKHFELDLYEVENVFKYLIERKLIKILIKHMSYNIYTSTAEGRDYFKIHFKSFFKDYIYPIITSAVALLLSLILK